MKRYLPAVVAVVAVVACGIVHGFWTDRWGYTEAQAKAAAALERLPMKVGDWEGKPLDTKAANQGLAGQVYRRYVNTRNPSEVVTIALVCGRPGRVSIHTPDVCYGASGYTVGKKSVQELGKTQVPFEFYEATAAKGNAAEKTNLRLIWSWRADDKWGVAEDPRLAFRGRSVVFKFYVIREVSAASAADVDQDPAAEFLRQFLPVLEETLAAD